MKKKITTIFILILSIITVILLVVRTTYSLIIEVTGKNGKNKIVNKIRIRDLLTDSNGIYNSTYYDTLNELKITSEEAEIVIESVKLNNTLNLLIENVIDYRFNGKEKLSNTEIKNLIISAINSDDTINHELKSKLINKTNEYIIDISNYLYKLETTKD